MVTKTPEKEICKQDGHDVLRPVIADQSKPDSFFPEGGLTETGTKTDGSDGWVNRGAATMDCMRKRCVFITLKHVNIFS